MKKASPISISISRQYGSGGEIIGSSLSQKLGFIYLDREIVMEAAKKLGVAYEEIFEFDEKNASFWKSFLYSAQYGDYTFSPAEHVPSDNEIHKVESEIVLSASKQQSVVVVGRGANFILKNEPNHVSIFLHAEEAIRVERIQKLLDLNQHDAIKIINQTDQSRERYTKRFAGHSMYDLRHYSLVIDTGCISFEQVEKLVLDYMKERFGEDEIQNLLNKKEKCDG